MSWKRTQGWVNTAHNKCPTTEDLHAPFYISHSPAGPHLFQPKYKWIHTVTCFFTQCPSLSVSEHWAEIILQHILLPKTGHVACCSCDSFNKVIIQHEPLVTFALGFLVLLSSWVHVLRWIVSLHLWVFPFCVHLLWVVGGSRLISNYPT